MKQAINERQERIGSLLYLSILFIIVMVVLNTGILGILLKSGVSTVIAGLISSQLSIILYGLTLYRFNFSEMKKMLIKPKLTHFLMIISGVILIVSFNFLMSISIKFLGYDTKNVDNYTQENIQSFMENGTLLATFIIPAIIAPIFEEITFRGALKYILVDKGYWKPRFYVIVSTLMFGFLHFSFSSPTILPVIMIGFIGLVNSIVYLKTKNILAPIGIHILYNLTILYLV